MKKTLIISFFLTGICLMAIVEARGGRGGGGRSVQRSPSMSRASGPSASHRASQPRSSQQRHSTASSQQRQRANQTRSPIASRPPASRPSAANAAQLQRISRNTQNNIRYRYPNRNDWFRRDFWDNHNYRPPYYGYNQNWWGNTSALGLASWLAWQSEPYYYAFDDFSYWEPSDVYASAIPSSNEWMPLGVFSISKNTESAATPNMFLQLAINKAGGIAGTFFNATTNKTQAIEGSVDPESQRAVWSIAGDEDAPVMETGIYNLTQPEVPVRIYFSNGRKQDRLLVRVNPS